MTATGEIRRAAFSIGSNLGDRLSYLQLAVDQIRADPGVDVKRVSQVYETAPVGGPQQFDYLNAVVIADTMLAPAELLSLAHRCEQAADRERSVRWGPRTLDVDVLAVGDVISNESALTLPHPRIGERAFVLRPWADVDPDFVVMKDVTVRELLTRVNAAGTRVADVQLWAAS